MWAVKDFSISFWTRMGCECVRSWSMAREVRQRWLCLLKIEISLALVALSCMLLAMARFANFIWPFFTVTAVVLGDNRLAKS